MAEFDLTIDELARRAGTTARNVRAYQARGLLPPPRLIGRVGYYGDGHLARLTLIARLQERGFSLAGIAALLNTWEEGGSLSDLLGFEAALATPWNEEGEQMVSLDDLLRMFPQIEDPVPFIERAVELDLLVPHGEGWRAVSPRLLRIAADLASRGIPLSALLDVAAELREDTLAIAARFVELFDHHVWRPFVDAGAPPEQLAEVTETLRRLRPTAFEAVAAALAGSMDRAVEDAAADNVAEIEEGLAEPRVS
jgi:DNA-binding transcriptional MerR regulator